MASLLGKAKTLDEALSMIDAWTAAGEAKSVGLVGNAAEVLVDGVEKPFPAKVTYISPRAEFTPPVIYSRQERAKLVFLIEARPAPADRPGPNLAPTRRPAPTTRLTDISPDPTTFLTSATRWRC